MDINTQLIITFALATLFETLIPGPTLALVIETRLSAGKKAVGETIAGVTAANIIWVFVAVFILYAGHSWFSAWGGQLITYIGTAYLMYLAARRILSSTVLWVAQYDEAYALLNKPKNFFVTGFMAHAANPLTVAYYITTFGLATAQQSVETKIAFGMVAVLSDLLVFGLIGFFKLGPLESFLRKPFFRLFAGMALFYLITHVFSSGSNTDTGLAITSLIVVLMLVGFLVAALYEAYHHVHLRQNKDNKVLWRIAKLWSVWFSVYAVFGAFYALVGGVSGSALDLGHDIEMRIRVCVIVATVIALALSFFKAYGELQDEQYQPSASTAVSPSCLQAKLWFSGIISLAFLCGVFLLMTVTNFQVH